MTVVLLGWVGWLSTGAWVLVIAPVVVSALALIRPSQVLLSRRATAILVQHRLRRGCSAAGLHGPDGTLPAVLWTKVVSHGETVYLRTPPTMTIEDFRAERDHLARACGARSVRVGRHSRSDQIVVLDVVRRDTEESAAVNLAVQRLPRPRQQSEV